MTNLKTKKNLKTNNKNKKRYNLSLIIGLIISFCLCFWIISLQITLSSKKAQLENIKKEINILEIKNKEISEAINSGNISSLIEKIAREDLLYVAPDERVFYDISGN